MTNGKSLSKRIVVEWVLLGVGSVLAGLLAQSIHIPAGWLVGPMLVAIASAFSWQKHPTLPRWARQVSLAVIGSLIAATYRPSVVARSLTHGFP